jgi:NADP-dependent 3-hydroxy acid dehydrogenase YdfG
MAVTAREIAKIRDIADAYPETALALSLDVTDSVQVSDAVQKATQRFRDSDILVNNAGYGYPAAIEEGVDDDVRQLFATTFGPVAMIQAVLPGMRASRTGTIVKRGRPCLERSLGSRVVPRTGGT